MGPQFGETVYISEVNLFHLLRQLAADTAHTSNTATQKIYRNTKFKRT